MPPLLALQFAVTVVTTVVFAKLLDAYTGAMSAYTLAALLWGGFLVPTQIGAVVFGGTEPKWVVKKTLIMAGAALGCVMIAAAVLTTMR